jgi:hypothetical protein
VWLYESTMPDSEHFLVLAKIIIRVLSIKNSEKWLAF